LEGDNTVESLEETRSDYGLRGARSGGATARSGWLTVAATVIAAVGLAGQDRPNLSGTWRVGLLPTPYAITGKGNRPDSQLGVGRDSPRLVIRQDAKVVEIEENAWAAIATAPNTLVYHLDGSAVTNPFRTDAYNVVVDDRGRSVGVNKLIPAEFRTKWKDGQLVSAITVQVPGEKEPRHYEETISLGADGVLSICIQRVGTGDSRTLYYKKQ
jgi:hypothetical protein